MEVKVMNVKRTDEKIIRKQVEIFKALAHPTRLQMVQMLSEGELCVCVFQEAFGIDFSTVSRHLSVLRNAGIVSDEKRGKNVFYRLVRPCVLEMCACLENDGDCRCGNAE